MARVSATQAVAFEMNAFAIRPSASSATRGRSITISVDIGRSAVDDAPRVRHPARRVDLGGHPDEDVGRDLQGDADDEDRGQVRDRRAQGRRQRTRPGAGSGRRSPCRCADRDHTPRHRTAPYRSRSGPSEPCSGRAARAYRQRPEPAEVRRAHDARPPLSAFASQDARRGRSGDAGAGAIRGRRDCRGIARVRVGGVSDAGSSRVDRRAPADHPLGGGTGARARPHRVHSRRPRDRGFQAASDRPLDGRRRAVARLPAGRLDGKRMRSAATRRADDPAVDQPTVDPADVIEARLDARRRPGRRRRGRDEPRRRSTRAPFGARCSASCRTGRSTAARCASSTTRSRRSPTSASVPMSPATCRSATATGRSRPVGRAGRAAGLTSIINKAHATGTRVVLTVQSFAWNSSGKTRQQALLTQLDGPRQPCAADRRCGPGPRSRRRQPRLRAARLRRRGPVRRPDQADPSEARRRVARIPTDVRHDRAHRQLPDRARDVLGRRRDLHHGLRLSRCLEQPGRECRAAVTRRLRHPRHGRRVRRAGVPVQAHPRRPLLRSSLVDGHEPRARQEYQRDQDTARRRP